MAKMIICASCGAEFDADQVRCPYCGTAYAPAEKEEYDEKIEELSKSERKDIRSAKRYRGLGRRAAILIALVIGIIVMSVVSSYNYADHDNEEAVRRDSEKNAVTYATEMDAYLERGDYVECVSFMYAHEIWTAYSTEYDRFRCVKHVARCYYECIHHMERIVLRSTDGEYFDKLDTDISNFCMYLDEFYKVFEAQRESEKDPKYLAYMEDMEEELKIAMKAYFDMDDAEVSEFLDLSQAKKGVRLEEVFGRE